MTENNKVYTLPKEELSFEQKVGQFFMPAVFINDTEEEVQKMERLIADYHVGSICFFHSRASAATNFEGKKKIVYNKKSYDRLQQLIQRYQKAARIPLLVAIDAEWGLAMRIENTPQLPYAITLGALNNQDHLIYEVGKAIGQDCKKAGIHWNLAPVVDINNNPENPVIGYRSFGDDKESVLSKASSYIHGMKSSGTLNSVKHFPGHGDTATDSHLGLPVIDKSMEELMENELYPFQKLIEKGVDSVMVGHLLLPQLDADHPSTTSSTIITDLLKTQLGFKGVVISDALNMHAVSKKYPVKGELEFAAFAAGMDVLCFSEHVAEGIEIILRNASTERIDASFSKIWDLKQQFFATDVQDEKMELNSHSKLNTSIAKECITELFGNPSAVENIKSSNFLNVSVNSGKENSFSKLLESEFNATSHGLSSDIGQDQPVVLSIFPPAVKPKDRFGFDEKTLEDIKKLVKKENVLVYLFGNPYVMDILGLEDHSNVVLAYQDFPEFQTAAFQHFKGEIKGKGHLPIQLKTFNP
ncbi:MAG: glycoside hydrolase family 3 protein [Muricauda sp.]|nr:glycoside hydrolase family 3 protein [Allomuricauda sp.]